MCTCSNCGSSPTQSQAGLSSVQYMSLHSLFSSTRYRHSMSCSTTVCHPSHSDMAGGTPHILRLMMRMSSTASRVLCAAIVCPCYIRNTALDSDGFRTGFWQWAQPLSIFHFLYISNILLHSLTVAYSQPSIIAPIPAYCNHGFCCGTPS
jgi:hypothetical protein